MKVRHWGVLKHPTVKPIPIAIFPRREDGGMDEGGVPLLKDASKYHYAEALVAEHNAVVDELNKRMKWEASVSRCLPNPCGSRR